LELTWNDFNGKFYDEIKAAYKITRVTPPNMIKHNYGRIVYIATDSAKYPNLPAAIVFGTTKASLVAFAKYIAQEYGRNGIKIIIVSPGLIETDQNKNSPIEMKQRYAIITTLGRVG
jgi:3-oxoacyl-[acyl-carrier protein] reductase